MHIARFGPVLSFKKNAHLCILNKIIMQFLQEGNLKWHEAILYLIRDLFLQMKLCSNHHMCACVTDMAE